MCSSDLVIMPATRTPALKLNTLDHDVFDLDKPEGKQGTLLVFYRGKHCPICTKQLSELDARLDDFAELGVDVVAISCDDEARAEKMKQNGNIERLKIAHSLSLPAARFDRGLFISSAREGSEEPALFSEPGVFLVTPERELYFSWVQSAPFARPPADDLLMAIRFKNEKNYPPRGQYDGALDKDA